MDQIQEPNGTFMYNGKEYQYWGNTHGHNRTVEYDLGKFNRYAKLGEMADEVSNRLKTIINSDPRSLNARNAYACLLMMQYGVRIGNEDSATGYESGMKQNVGEFVQTFGTTTLQNDHISFDGNVMKLHFLGKEQVQQDIQINDPYLVKTGKLFYDPRRLADKWIGIDYDTLFKFIRENIGEGFVPKDMRTFCANITGWNLIQNYLAKPQVEMKSEANAEIKEIVEIVSNKLGNTPGIAKRNYLDARMLDWFKAQRFEDESI